jgi:hypothetical protein
MTGLERTKAIRRSKVDRYLRLFDLPPGHKT